MFDKMLPKTALLQCWSKAQPKRYLTQGGIEDCKGVPHLAARNCFLAKTNHWIWLDFTCLHSIRQRGKHGSTHWHSFKRLAIVPSMSNSIIHLIYEGRISDISGMRYLTYLRFFLQKTGGLPVLRRALSSAFATFQATAEPSCYETPADASTAEVLQPLQPGSENTWCNSDFGMNECNV